MIARLPASLVVLLCSFTAAAEVAPWQAVAHAPLPGLPTITVSLGDPGYISTGNAPITLKAVGGSRPFDGHLGYHLAVAEKKTVDVPVVARAVLRPGERWSFATWAEVRSSKSWKPASLNRELVMEWRDRDMAVVATKNVGVPPWSHPRPLYVLAASEMAPAGCCLGREPHLVRAVSLRDVAQGYAGYSDVVMATETWLDLPVAVREAIFASGIHAVFVGLPRSGQAMTAMDRALIAVAFTDAPGAYTVPWPYSERPKTVAVPKSWRPTESTDRIGGEQSPYLVRAARSTFAAEMSAIRFPLPAMRAVPVTTFGGVPDAVALPRVADVVAEFWPAIVTAIVLFACVTFAVMAKRGRRPVALLSSVAVAIIVLMVRDWMRPAAAAFVAEESVVQQPGVVRTLRFIDEYGPSPIPEQRVDPEVARTTVSGAGEIRQVAELRSSTTAPGLGTMFGPAYDSTSRWTERSELREPVEVRILRRSKDDLAFRYESDIPLDLVRARWIWNGQVRQGDVHLPGGKEGEAVVRAGRALHPLSSRWDAHRMARASAAVRIVFVRQTRAKTTVIEWTEPANRDIPARSPWTMVAVASREADGTFRRHFAVPAGRLTSRSTMFVQISGMLPLKAVRCSVSGRNWTLPREKSGRYIVEPEAVKELAAGGGVLSVVFEAENFDGPPPQIRLSVEEKQS